MLFFLIVWVQQAVQQEKIPFCESKHHLKIEDTIFSLQLAVILPPKFGDHTNFRDIQHTNI